MPEIKSSIVRVYELMGEEITEQKCLEPNFWVILHEIDRDPSKFSAELAEALKTCIYDFPTDREIPNVASLLLQRHFNFPDLISFLSPWDQLMFKWQSEGLTLAKAGTLLKHADFDHELLKEAQDRFAKFLFEPARYFGNHAEIARILFGNRCIELTQNMDEYPPVDESFSQLFNQSGFQENITEASQSEDDDYAHTIVHFLFRGKKYQFKVVDDMCIQGELRDELMVNFDAFMAYIGREERIFDLTVPSDYPEQIGCFVVAKPESFAQLCQALHVPASRVQTTIKPSFQPYQEFEHLLPPPDIIPGDLLITSDNIARYQNIVEVQRLSLNHGCELPKLCKAKSLSIRGGSVVLPKLEQIEEDLRIESSGKYSTSLLAPNLVSIGDSLFMYEADGADLPKLRSVGNKLVISGKEISSSNATYLNAPELDDVKVVVEGMINVVLNTPKLKRIPNSEICSPHVTFPHLGRCTWNPEPPNEINQV